MQMCRSRIRGRRGSRSRSKNRSRSLISNRRRVRKWRRRRFKSRNGSRNRSRAGAEGRGDLIRCLSWVGSRSSRGIMMLSRSSSMRGVRGLSSSRNQRMKKNNQEQSQSRRYAGDHKILIKVKVQNSSFCLSKFAVKTEIS